MDQFSPKNEWLEKATPGDDYDELDANGMIQEEVAIPVAVQKKTALEYLKKTYLAQKADHVVFISAQTGENVAELRELLYSLVKEKHYYIYPNWVNVPLSESAEYGDGLAD